ncbi:MAG TPA: NAD(P)-dependent alcohol dehydrogenase [Bryobacteraceae bacterium]|nr:NAD(P)-dependent alcohol dehydrogenase [Bryobacteraceae bacterium]
MHDRSMYHATPVAWSASKCGMSEIHALAASEVKGRLKSFSYDPGPLGDEQVELEVLYCGICHSDVAMLNNEWGFSRYPLVPGHEVIGRVVEMGSGAKLVGKGQIVGLGWNSGSCLHCRQCLTGDHNMCESLEQTIVGRNGGFADRVRCHWVWATPLPAGVDPAKAGPLFCGGITVFNPLLQDGVLPIHRAAVIGIGGLGHMAVQFLNKWGCDVTAFTSSEAKGEEAKKMGAHHVIDTHSAKDLKKAKGSFDFVLSTVTASLDWNAYASTLAPKGRLHIVGIPPEPIAIPAFPLIAGQRSIGGSPSGAPATVAKMLDFCARHGIEAVTEEFPMSRANEALAQLEAGKARYRVVLKNDLA